MKKCILMFALLIMAIVLAVWSESREDHSLMGYGMLEKETSDQSSMLSQKKENPTDVYAEGPNAIKK